MVILLMGVTGSGKTTVGKVLAAELGWKFADADDFHSPQNVAKMHAGIALSDEDREPWLVSLGKAIQNWTAEKCNVVLACSALKEIYRARLLVSSEVKVVYLRGEYEEIRRRLAQRREHYMNPELLRSQFDALEEPRNAVTVDITPSPEEISSNIRHALGI